MTKPRKTKPPRKTEPGACNTVRLPNGREVPIPPGWEPYTSREGDVFRVTFTEQHPNPDAAIAAAGDGRPKINQARPGTWEEHEARRAMEQDYIGNPGEFLADLIAILEREIKHLGGPIEQTGPGTWTEREPEKLRRYAVRLQELFDKGTDPRRLFYGAFKLGRDYARLCLAPFLPRAEARMAADAQRHAAAAVEWDSACEFGAETERAALADGWPGKESRRRGLDAIHEAMHRTKRGGADKNTVRRYSAWRRAHPDAFKDYPNALR
jgi:hypothetical protein